MITDINGLAGVSGDQSSEFWEFVVSSPFPLKYFNLRRDQNTIVDADRVIPGKSGRAGLVFKYFWLCGYAGRAAILD